MQRIMGSLGLLGFLVVSIGFSMVLFNSSGQLPIGVQSVTYNPACGSAPNFDALQRFLLDKGTQRGGRCAFSPSLQYWPAELPQFNEATPGQVASFACVNLEPNAFSDQELDEVCSQSCFRCHGAKRDVRFPQKLNPTELAQYQGQVMEVNGIRDMDVIQMGQILWDKGRIPIFNLLVLYQGIDGISEATPPPKNTLPPLRHLSSALEPG